MIQRVSQSTQYTVVIDIALELSAKGKEIQLTSFLYSN